MDDHLGPVGRLGKAVYTTYILPSGGLYATYHLLGEPETTIEPMTDPWDESGIFTDPLIPLKPTIHVGKYTGPVSWMVWVM